jgi:hypothetical protein
MSFGFRNELQAHEQFQRDEESARTDAVVALIALLIFAVYVVAAYLDQPGVGQ